MWVFFFYNENHIFYTVFLYLYIFLMFCGHTTFVRFHSCFCFGKMFSCLAGRPGSVTRARALGVVSIRRRRWRWRRRQSIVALAPVAPIALVIVIIGAAGCMPAVVVVYRTARHRLHNGVHRIYRTNGTGPHVQGDSLEGCYSISGICSVQFSTRFHWLWRMAKTVIHHNLSNII